MPGYYTHATLANTSETLTDLAVQAGRKLPTPHGESIRHGPVNIEVPQPVDVFCS